MFSMPDFRRLLQPVHLLVDSPPGGLKVMEKPDDEGSPGATGGEGDGRDATPVHSTGTPDGIAALGAMLQGFMLVQQQQQQSMQTMQQQMQQQISQLQEEVQNGKTKQLCVVTPLPAANPDTLTRPAPQSLGKLFIMQLFEDEDTIHNN